MPGGPLRWIRRGTARVYGAVACQIEDQELNCWTALLAARYDLPGCASPASRVIGMRCSGQET